MDTQIYQPLSAALHPPQQQPNRSQQHPGYQYPPGHAQPSAASNGIHHNNREEEEEEEDEDEDIVEEELEQHNRDHQSPSTHSSPRVAAAHAAKSIGYVADLHSSCILTFLIYLSRPHLVGTSTQYNLQVAASSHDANQDGGDDSKRKPGRPRGSRNRKPRAPANSSTKAPANSQHPGFYQYPPAPAGAVAQNQQFYEFQWRALNLCSEFYNAAEELIVSDLIQPVYECASLSEPVASYRKLRLQS
ncbi:hypothetical protein PHLCEN_2v11184 [Hermanssonia centrifuga]|uniref:Uncharacterized protein n=1 Tax=Hermanssonia centrifuga TaxID=98765 RepID=A0A2R6NKP9_9APHY|nr:hypothetical protein PHLCEN_2v11184 [Hermanssonia centrifuga]